MSQSINCEPLKELVRTVPDFPKPGILFYDITTLLKDKAGFAQLIDAFAAYYIGKDIDLILGIEARGFIFGPALAYRLNAGFVPVRKPKKLPAKTARVSYDLEYGTDALEMHDDGVRKGQRVLIVDDLLATGGTSRATADLVSNPPHFGVSDSDVTRKQRSAKAGDMRDRHGAGASGPRP